MAQYLFFLIVGVLITISGIYSKDTKKILRIIDVVFGIITIFAMLFKLFKVC